MINEQVRRYFYGLRVNRIFDIIRESLIDVDLSHLSGRRFYVPAYGLLTEGLGIDMYVDDDDLDWIHNVRVMFVQQNAKDISMVPKPYQIFAVRYALLHPGPHLHDYQIKEDNGVLKIIEKMRIGGGARFEDKEVATVGQDMYDVYTKATGKIAQAGKDKKAADREVAEWWVQENRDALHDYLAKGSKRKPLPDPQVKILARKGSTVDLAFRRPSRGASAKYAWMVVKDIPMDLAKLRAKAEKEGYTDLKHAQAIVNYRSWDKLFEKEGKSDAPQKPSRKGNGKFRIAHEEAEERGESPVYHRLYINEPEFQNRVEYFIIKNVNAAIRKLTGGSRINIKQGEDAGKHEINVPVDFHSLNIDEGTIRDIMQEIRLRFSQTTAEISDENWEKWKETFAHDQPVSHWAFQKISSIAQTETSKGLGLKLKGGLGSVRSQGSGGGEKGDGSREGGHEELGAFSGAAKGNVAKVSDDPARAAIDAEDAEEERQNNMAVIMGALRNPELLRSRPDVLSKIKAAAKEDPKVLSLLQGMGIDLNNLGRGGSVVHQPTEPDEDEMEDDDDDIGFNKYNRAGVRQESKNPYSFRSYLQNKINEMGLPWGNDKKSSKIIKPHQNLKGGIQVQGAPWTAGGGPNYEGNDVKIKH